MNRSHLIRFALVFVILLAAAAPARADDGLRIGVVIATGVNVSDGEADALGTALGDALRDQLGADVVAGPESRRRLPTGGLGEDCVARPECVQDIAERLGADELLFLVVVRIGPRVQIDPTWARPRTRQVASRGALVIEDGQQAAATVFARAARRLFPEAAPRLVRVNAPLPAATRARERRITRGTAIAGAVSLAALAGGVGLALAARSDYDDLEGEGCDQRTCPDIDDRVDSMENKALAADVLFGAAAVAAGVAVFLYLDSGGAEEAPVRVGADPHGAHVWLGGRF
jgi:hypothetical protein